MRVETHPVRGEVSVCALSRDVSRVGGEQFGLSLARVEVVKFSKARLISFTEFKVFQILVEVGAVVPCRRVHLVFVLRARKLLISQQRMSRLLTAFVLCGIPYSFGNAIFTSCFNRICQQIWLPLFKEGRLGNP